MSVVVLALGAALTVYVVRRESGRQAPAGRGERAYATTYDELIHGAKRVTRYTQSGSLPAYLGIVFTTLLVIVVVALLSGIGDAGGWPWADSALQVVAAILTGLIGLSVLTARRRFTAAVLLGGTGYGLAIVFLIHGAPDLALTQFLVETITIVMFLLVLGRLPDRLAEGPRWAPSSGPHPDRGPVGAAVAAFAMVISVSRTAPSVGDEYLARTVPEGGGRNSVNVTLVDFRGFDTQGEITVLAVAAVGVVNIVGVARREQRRKRLLDGTDDSRPTTSRPTPSTGWSDEALHHPHDHGVGTHPGSPVGLALRHVPRAQRTRRRVRRGADHGNRGRPAVPRRWSARNPLDPPRPGGVGRSRARALAHHLDGTAGLRLAVHGQQAHRPRRSPDRRDPLRHRRVLRHRRARPGRRRGHVDPDRVRPSG